MTFFEQWNIPDETGTKRAEINGTTVDGLHDSIQRALAWKWLHVTSGKQKAT